MEFTLVALLLVLLVVSIVQISLALYVRNVVVDAAGEGARHGALLGGDRQSAIERTEQIITASVSEQYAQQITSEYATVDGIETLVVSVAAPIPVFGLAGIGQVEAEGHGVLELL
ncbi:TadE/TadG family type IV pilus assembly protein [Agrococcus casei]|uniref:Putative membrane protein n=1 Tax=Agrococcus casei LMG 22410 TaxID=1255656 RepID=A0A1R4FKI0_9MICO|nr:putative membrane protein [Agrococcus casei LMG 22410]